MYWPPLKSNDFGVQDVMRSAQHTLTPLEPLPCQTLKVEQILQRFALPFQSLPSTAELYPLQQSCTALGQTCRRAPTRLP